MTMDFKSALTTWLKTRAPLVAVVYDPGLGDARVYPLRKPQGAAFPQLCWWVSGRTRHKALDGPVGITTARVRFDCRGRTLADADVVAAALRRPPDAGGLDGYRGDMAGVFCQALLFTDDGDGDDDQDPPSHGEQAGTALVSITATITFEEPS